MTYTDGINLTADTLEELHKFAIKIGLGRAKFKERTYDVSSHNKAAIATALGAKKITSKELLTISKSTK